MEIASSTGTSIRWLQDLQPDERRGVFLLREYQKACRKVCGAGYRGDPIVDESCKDRPSFKQAVTVAKWMSQEGIRVGVTELNWAGYVEYVFEHFARIKAVPAVGQLKNPVLLKKFFQHANVSFDSRRQRSDAELERIYSRSLLPEVAQNVGMLHLLGLLRSDRSCD